jgi:predicted acyl esterase
MSIMSRLIGRISRLPPAETYDIGVEKDLAIPMPDGVALLADHYYPRNLGPRPTMLGSQSWKWRNAGNRSDDAGRGTRGVS